MLKNIPRVVSNMLDWEVPVLVIPRETTSTINKHHTPVKTAVKSSGEHQSSSKDCV
jgi:hypothetical protein